MHRMLDAGIAGAVKSLEPQLIDFIELLVRTPSLPNEVDQLRLERLHCNCYSTVKHAVHCN